MTATTRMLTVFPVLTGVLTAGCLLIGATEHRIRFRDDGSGEARLRLIDIRSDGETDSAVALDLTIMLSSFRDEGVKDFERGGRRIRSKQFVVHGDTLTAEVIYAFAGPEDIEGLVVTRDEMYVIVGQGRIVAHTNGTIVPIGGGSVKVVWPADARRLSYEIRETALPPSVPLARWYQSAQE